MIFAAAHAACLKSYAILHVPHATYGLPRAVYTVHFYVSLKRAHDDIVRTTFTQM